MTTATPTPETPAHPRRILLVDDSELSRAMITRLLGRKGYAVLTAGDGAEGAVTALREQPDLVITDLDMPVMDGYQLARLLKSDPATEHMALVILTSHGAASSRFWGLETGADAFLVKRDIESTLLETVEPLLETPRTAPKTVAEAPKTPLEVLARVSRQLDSRLLEAVLVNRMLERGMQAETLRDASRSILDTVSDIVDTWMLGLALYEGDALTVRLRLQTETSHSAVETATSHLTEILNVPPSASCEVKVEGGGGEREVEVAASGAVLELALRGARAALLIVPRHPGYRDSREHLLLGRACRQLSLVLDNVRLAERLRELSMRDGLTRLFNRRTVHQRLEEEVHRANRYGHAVAAILCDLDRFKEVNDTHGHQAGDQVLVAVAEILEQQGRAHDISGRYGGEEFLLVLPETDLENALLAAERLRRMIEACEIVLDGGGKLQVTASFGVASSAEIDAGEGGSPAHALLALADERLYAAKGAGRNRVMP